MHAELIAHPTYPPHSIKGVEVVVEQAPGNKLKLRYWVFGDVDELRLPAAAAPLRTDDLWRTTCFEAFVAPRDSASYIELNFSPSTQWAAYSFKSYREPEREDAQLPSSPSTTILLHRASRISIEVDVSLALGGGSHRLGLSAVLEERDGTKSYWALAHRSEEPDFHDPDCFALELPAALHSSPRT